jgi:Tol biopolymer transport system component
MSPDGKTLFFGSNRPRKRGDEKLPSLDIYYSRRTGPGKWTEPHNLSKTVNSDFNENYPSIDSAGNVYFFSSRNEGLGGCEIYVSKYENSRYKTPELLDKNINSYKNDWDSFISPDGNYIIFSSQNRDDTIGRQDLYISFKDKNGRWTKAVNMGPRVNSTGDEICPSVSLDGKYFFFTSRRRGTADIFWIDAKIIDELKGKL